MTDNEIKKALECCQTHDMLCDNCPLFSDWDCTFHLRKKSLDLVNRQQAKIENLEVEKLHLAEFLAESERNVKDLESALEDAREEIEKLEVDLDLYRMKNEILIEDSERTATEAIREFAERLWDELCGIPQYDFNLYCVKYTIDNLVEEMVGEENGC